MKDTRLIIPKGDLEIIIAKFYHLKDVSLERVNLTTYDSGAMEIYNIMATANYPKKWRKK